MHRYGSKREKRTVTAEPWYTSVSTGDGIDGAILHVYRDDPRNPKRLIHGEGDGKRFPTTEAAWAYALAHGYNKPYEPKRAFGPSHESYLKKWPPTLVKCPGCSYATIYPGTLERHRERRGH